MQRFAWSPDGRPDFLGGPVAAGTELTPPSEAAAYAVVCSGARFVGHFCVGLPAPGRYGVDELLVRGVQASAIRSVRLHGGAAVTLFAGDESAGGEQAWTTAVDAEELPSKMVGAVRLVAVHLEPAAEGSPSAGSGSLLVLTL